MRLASFTIGSDREGERQRFKNLKNVTIDFEEQEWITLVIGWNGTGKSNVLEALATAFLELIGKPQKRVHTLNLKLLVLLTILSTFAMVST